jgi:succinoglycan biosynthesis protein ExoO
VTDRRLIPATGGNRQRILGLIRAVRALDWRVALIVTTANADSELRAEVDELFAVEAASFPGGDPRRFDARPFCRELERVVSARRPAVVIAEYAWLAPVFSSIPREIPRWIDCHDLLHERTARFQAAGLDPWVTCDHRQERALLRRAHLVIASQHREEHLFRALLPGQRVVCLLPHIDLPDAYSPHRTESTVVLAVGADHAGNDGIRQFAADPWASVTARIPAARLQVVGSIGKKIAPQPHVEVCGEVADLHRCYELAAVVICPIVIGTGVKIKMLEALRLGKAVVATAAAVEGLPITTKETWRTVSSLRECADAVGELLLDREARRQLEDAAFAYGEEHLSRHRLTSELRACLPGPLSRRLSRWTA